MYKNINFSLWCDFVERDFLKSEFKVLLEKKVFNGATSNPAIFKSAFLNSPAYKSDREKLKDLDAKEVYETLAIEDIKLAAKTLLPLYEKGDDGFISIEVDPLLCDDAEGTIKEGKKLFEKIGYPNVMIKVPATNAGYKAMQSLMSEGINVNATLIFSQEQAQNCLSAFKKANEKLGVNLPKAVISVFVSRFDSKLDERLKSLGLPEAKVGIYNAIKIYDLIESYGLENVRTLFASTGVKRDDLRADYYIKELLFKNSINTAPLATIKEFIKNDDANEIKLKKDYVEFFDKLEENGIDMQKVYDELLEEGLQSFKDAFKQILKEL
ncbi:transaldolase [Sulfurospirillum sp. 1307]|jgi:transaldolase